jgi:hypothetical protein
MSMRDRKEYIIWNNVTPVAVTSSTDATPIVVTATSHGFTNGQQVQIFGHTTNIAANGMFEVYGVTANTFKLRQINGGADVAGSGSGAGASGVVVLAPKVPFLGDFRNVIFSFGTTGTATLAVKIAGSAGKSVTADPDMPNFGATVSPTNPYTYIQIINLDTGAAVNGATGIAPAGADVNNTYEVNVNAIKYLAPVIQSWTQGAITMKMYLTDNE